MIGLLFFGVVLAVFALLSNVFGVDSRSGSPDPRSPIYPVGIR
jgi:hypothetical protein